MQLFYKKNSRDFHPYLISIISPKDSINLFSNLFIISFVVISDIQSSTSSLTFLSPPANFSIVKFISSRSLINSISIFINIYGNSKDGVWVGDFDEKSYFQLPDEVKKLIENILELLGAEKTDDECVYSLDAKKEDKKDDKKEDKKDDKKDDEEDVEDDKSRDEDDVLSL